MSKKKKYNRYLPDPEYHHVVLYEHEDESGIGTAQFLNFNDGWFGYVKLNWGAEIDYMYDAHGRVEIDWVFDKKETRKLMLRTGTKNGKELIDELKRRFINHGRWDETKFNAFLKDKGINYQYYI